MERLRGRSMSFRDLTRVGLMVWVIVVVLAIVSGLALVVVGLRVAVQLNATDAPRPCKRDGARSRRQRQHVALATS